MVDHRMAPGAIAPDLSVGVPLPRAHRSGPASSRAHWTAAGDDIPDRITDPATDPAERMLLLVFRTACRLGLSRRATTRLCRAVLPTRGEPAAKDTGDVPGSEPPQHRRLRRHVLTALRTRLRRHDRTELESALGAAVLLDELSLLPPRQRLTLWATAVQHRTVADVASQNGWTETQVTRLVHAALTSLTLRSRS